MNEGELISLNCGAELQLINCMVRVTNVSVAQLKDL